MAPNGQASAHAPQPMQRASTTSTKPLLSFRIALTGQALMHGASSHCLHVIAISEAGSVLTTRMRDAFGLKIRSWKPTQTSSHVLQPVHNFGSQYMYGKPSPSQKLLGALNLKRFDLSTVSREY